MNITGRPIYQKPAPKKADPVHMGRVAKLPCVICWEFDMRQNSPTEVHHCKSGRYGRNRSPDIMVIPLCHSHHHKLRPYPGDEDKIGFHNAQATWESEYGEDHEWLSWVEARL
jgi:hypothetical protein